MICLILCPELSKVFCLCILLKTRLKFASQIHGTSVNCDNPMYNYDLSDSLSRIV